MLAVLATLGAVAGWGAPPLAAQQNTAAVGPGVSLADAVELARRNNPEFLQSRNDQGVSEWAARNAYQEFLPTAYASGSFGYRASGTERYGSQSFGETPSYYSTGYSIGVQYDLSREKLLRPRLARARQSATDQQVASNASLLASDVAQQYIAVLEAQENVTQAEREVARATEQVRIAEARVRLGAGIALDVRRAEVGQGQAELARLRAANAVAIARLQLEQRLGTALPAGARLTSRFELWEPRFDAATLVAAAIRQNPALSAARSQERYSETSLRVARSAYLPQLNFQVGLNASALRAANVDPLVERQIAALQGNLPSCQESNRLRAQVFPNEPPRPCPNPSDPEIRRALVDAAQDQQQGLLQFERQPATAGISISLPLYTGIGRPLNVQQARADAEDARLRVRQQELRLRTEIGAGVENARTAYAAARLQQRVRAISAEELRLAQERFRAGAASSIEVSEAQARLAAAERDEINAVYAFHRALAALEALTGSPLRPNAADSAAPSTSTPAVR